MTELTVGLVVLGAAALAGVLLYNRRQERAVRKEAERAFGRAHPDVLLKRATPPDPRVDYVIELSVPGEAARALIDAWRAIEQRFARRALLDEAQAGKWHAGL